MYDIKPSLCAHHTVAFVLNDMLMQADLEQKCVRTILGTAILITASLLELERNQLRLVPNMNISGKLARGRVDYLLMGQRLQVTSTAPSLPLTWGNRHVHAVICLGLRQGGSDM